jgi:hypothetical protein
MHRCGRSNFFRPAIDLASTSSRIKNFGRARMMLLQCRFYRVATARQWRPRARQAGNNNGIDAGDTEETGVSDELGNCVTAGTPLKEFGAHREMRLFYFMMRFGSRRGYPGSADRDDNPTRRPAMGCGG